MPPNDVLYTASGAPNYLLEITASEFKRVIKANVHSKDLIISDKINVGQIPATCTLDFSIHYRAQYGDTLAIVGSLPELGSWNPTNALLLNWSEGDTWICNIPINKLNNIGKRFDYKYIVKRDGVPEPIRWESIPNRWHKLPDLTAKDLTQTNVSSEDKWDVIYERRV
jgi:hypothetical protein